MCSVDFFLGVLAIMFPPLPVWVKCGICSADSLINILLCCLGFLPGLLHSWYIIAKYPETPYYDYEPLPQDVHRSGRVTYVVVAPQNHPPPAPKPYNHHAQTRGPQQQQQQQQQQPSNYGTVSGPSQVQQGQTYAQVVAGSSTQADDGAAPPPYTEVAGDNKVQTRD